MLQTLSQQPQVDLFSEEVVLSLPPRFAVKGSVLGNAVEQLLTPRADVLCRLDPFTKRRVGGYETTLPSGERIRIISKKTATTFGDDLVLIVPDACHPKEIAKELSKGAGTWLHPVPITSSSISLGEAEERLLAVTVSWEDAFQLREARPATADKPATRGLRKPQVGALHAALSHATRSSGPATIVMPTGTGKTETMLAVQVSRLINRILAVVPTDALRDQIAGKFLTLGVLKDQECLLPGASYPVVAKLSHIPSSVDEVDEIFLRANVIVTTMHIAGRATAEVQDRMADLADALFIDEAHHIGAKTWAEFRTLFAEHKPAAVPILQFTATPFREDGRRVDGEFIYTYPLKKARDEGYFKPIRFEAVFGLDQDEADVEIATKLGEVLSKDLENGFNHLAIARCRRIERAKALHGLYVRMFPQFRPVLVHSQQPESMRRASLGALRRFESRIVICVDMLGEGFDLPELKIAALHDHCPASAPMRQKRLN